MTVHFIDRSLTLSLYFRTSIRVEVKGQNESRNFTIYERVEKEEREKDERSLERRIIPPGTQAIDSQHTHLVQHI